MPIPVASASRSVASAAATAAAPPDSSGARVASGDWRAAAEVRSQDCCTESCPRTSKGWTAGAARSVRRSLSRSAMLSRAAARATRAATAPQLLGGAWQETAGADRTSGPRPHDDCGRAPRSTLVSRPPWTSHAPVRHRTARRRCVAPSPESPRGATRRWSSLSGTEHERAAAPDTGATEASTSLSTRTASAEPGRWPQAQGCRVRAGERAAGFGSASRSRGRRGRSLAAPVPPPADRHVRRRLPGTALRCGARPTRRGTGIRRRSTPAGADGAGSPARGHARPGRSRRLSVRRHGGRPDLAGAVGPPAVVHATACYLT